MRREENKQEKCQMSSERKDNSLFKYGISFAERYHFYFFFSGSSGLVISPVISTPAFLEISRMRITKP